ncbi:MAG: CBASS cGAMP synthase [Saccharospirillum sp.]|uniref:CBASS cGAMP synthase n=1 Tax=Saccharospirillum sp. TaxID=2033801 RepID=UPI003298127E
MKYNIDKLLESGNKSLLDNITPGKEVEQSLKERRKEIREVIRQAFREVASVLDQDNRGWSVDDSLIPTDVAERIRTLDASGKAELKKLKPKFKTQGSFVYQTMNLPCHDKQQLDLDDGVYLPIEVMRHQPIVSKQLFFEIVDAALAIYANRKGYKFIGSKPTCARIEISNSMHIDIPLYAIPKDQYMRFLETYDQAALKGLNKREAYLESDEVYLARRDEEHWVKSDPMQINDWFEAEKSKYPKRLVRTCRFFKAWRDYTWTAGGPSSITLMASVVNTFNDHDGFDSLSEAILICSKELKQQLAEGVPSPIEGESNLFPRNGMKGEEINGTIEKATEFARTVKKALEFSHTKGECNSEARTVFGSRLPYTPDDIEQVLSQKIRETPAKVVPQEDTPNMDAG